MISIHVSPVNDPPHCKEFHVTVKEDQSVSKNLKEVCTDVDGDPLSYALVKPSPDGMVQFKESSLVFIPQLDFHGETKITFRARDSQGALSLSVIATIHVSPFNDLPVGNDQKLTTLEDTSLPISLTGLDLDTDPGQLHFQLISQPDFGRLEGKEPNLEYHPSDNFHGSDQFMFIVADGETKSKIGIILIDVIPVNDPPTCKQLTMKGPEDQIIVHNLGESCMDVDQDPLSFEIISPSRHGTAWISGSEIFFLPHSNFHGESSLSFRARDPQGRVSQTNLLRVFVSSITDAPLAFNQTLDAFEDKPLPLTLMGADIETDPDDLRYHIVASPVHGEIHGSLPALTYIPHPNYNGPDSLSFTVTDIGESKRTSLTSKEATIFIRVNPVNDSPVIAPIKDLSVEEGKLLQWSVEVKDIDLDLLSLSARGLPAKALFNPETGVLQYSPDFGVSTKKKNRVFEMSFLAEDGQGGSAAQSTRLLVKDINQAPVVSDQLISMDEDAVINIPLTGKDSDGDPLQFIIMKEPQYGILKEDGGRLSYRPRKNFYGRDTFLFQASDGLLTSKPAKIQIEIQPINDAPKCSDTTIELGLNQSISYDLMPYCSDIDGDPIVILMEAQAGSGSFKLLGSVLSYVPC